MPFRIGKIFEIESGHLLSKHAGNCRFPHGHSRRVEIVVVSDTLDATDMVCDFQILKAALGPFLAEWDHALCVNTADPHFATWQKIYGARIVPFPGTDPTSERMAEVIFREASRRLRDRVAAAARVEKVRVSETSSGWAEYFACSRPESAGP